MSDAELKPDTVLLGERNYELSLDLVIARAQNELLIFDQHFKTGAFKSLQRYEIIRDFLQNNAQSRLQIILHEADFFTQHCPRLFELLTLYGHKMSVLTTNDNAKIAKDCFVIADGLHTVRRVHIDHARFKYTLDDTETAASLRQRFDEILAETAEPVTPTTLGL